jgi:hypothetical protein
MYERFATFTDQMTVAFLDRAIAGGITFSLTYIRGALLIMVLTAGVLCWFGKLDLWWVVRRTFVALVIILLLRTGGYNTYIREPFWVTIPNGIASALAGHGVGITPARRFDVVRASAAHLIAYADGQARGLLYIRAQFSIGIAQGVMKILLFVIFALWLISRLGVALLISVGPFVLIAAIFDSTRHIVVGWFGKLMSLMVWTLCALALTELCLAGLIQWVNEANAMAQNQGLSELVDTLWDVVAWFGICAGVMLALPYYAGFGGGGAAGGVHAGMGIVAGSAMAAARMGAGAGKAMARAFKASMK